MKTKTKSGKIATAEATAEGKEATMTVTEKHLGRPVDPNSSRQVRLKEKQEKMIDGIDYVPLGRSIVPNSKRQLKLKEIAAKKEAGFEAKKGRPAMTEEQKEQARVEREAKRQAYIAALKAKGLEVPAHV